MKPYTITFERKLDRSPQSYTILAKDRDDAIDFCRRVHRVDFKRVISCRAVQPTKTDVVLELAEKSGFPIKTLTIGDAEPADAVGYLTQESK